MLGSDMATELSNELENENFTNLADLHMHLGSAATAHLLWELAHQRGIVLPEKNYWKFLDFLHIDEDSNSNKLIDYHSYHNYFDLGQLIQSSPEAVEYSVHEAVSLSYRKGEIDLLEVRFNPMRRNLNKMYDLDRILLGACIGMRKAMMEYPIKVGLIVEMDRRFNLAQNTVIADKAIKFRHEGVVGIDISGPHTEGFSFKEVAPIIDKARSYGLGVTVHAGEERPVEEVEEVLKYICPDRIGHGISAVSKPEVIAEIARKGIVLEVCPTSNVTLKMVDGWDHMSQIMQTLYTNGVKLTINSDGPVFLQTNSLKEMQKLLEKGIFTKKELQEFNQNAHQATFIKKNHI